MKIYDTTGVKISSILDKKELGTFLIEAEIENVCFSEAFDINGCLYQPMYLDLSTKVLAVEVLEMVEGDPEEEFGNQFICPYCGEEYEDDFELEEGEHECNCPHCHSKLKYNKEICFEYTVEPVERVKINKL